MVIAGSTITANEEAAEQELRMPSSLTETVLQRSIPHVLDCMFRWATLILAIRCFRLHLNQICEELGKYILAITESAVFTGTPFAS